MKQTILDIIDMMGMGVLLLAIPILFVLSLAFLAIIQWVIGWVGL